MPINTLPPIKASQIIYYLNTNNATNPYKESLYVTSVDFVETENILSVRLKSLADAEKNYQLKINADTGAITAEFNTKFYLTNEAATTAFNNLLNQMVEELEAINDINNGKIVYLNSLMIV